jgi:hypothetical protein
VKGLINPKCTRSGVHCKCVAEDSCFFSVKYVLLQRMSNTPELQALLLFEDNKHDQKNSLSGFWQVVNHGSMLSGSLVTTAWRVHRLQLEKASRYGG